MVYTCLACPLPPAKLARFTLQTIAAYVLTAFEASITAGNFRRYPGAICFYDVDRRVSDVAGLVSHRLSLTEIAFLSMDLIVVNHLRVASSSVSS